MGRSYVCGYWLFCRCPADPSLLEQPFLLLWERSFYGLVEFPASLLSWLTLSTVAAIDMVTIFIVLVLTWQIQSQVNVRQGELDRAAHATGARLSQLSWRAALVLAPRTVGDARLAEIHAVAEGLLVEIRAEHDRLEVIRTRREDETALLAEFSHEFEESIVALSAVTTTLNKAAQTAEIVSTSLDERLEEGASKLEGIALALASALVAIERVGKEAGASSEAVAHASALLVDASGRGVARSRSNLVLPSRV